MFAGLRPQDGTLTEQLNTPEGLVAAQTPIPAFRCPADDGPRLNNARLIQQAGGGNLIATAVSNYVANNNASLPMWDQVDFGNDGIAPWEMLHGPFAGSSNGRGIGLVKFFDGTSTSILVGERKYHNGYVPGGTEEHVAAAIPRAALLYGSRGTGHTIGNPIDYSTWHGMMDVGFCGMSPINDFSLWHKDRTVSSNHSGGVVFAFADGSVKFVTDTIEHIPRGAVDSVYEQLLAIDDGLAITSKF